MKMEIFFRKKRHSEILVHENVFGSPQTQRQVSATARSLRVIIEAKNKLEIKTYIKHVIENVELNNGLASDDMVHH